MVRRLRSQARRAADAVPATRTRETRQPARLRSRFRRVRPRVTAATPPAPRATSTASGVHVTVQFSKDLTARTVGASYLGQELLDRWATIQAGGVPADDDEVRQPPTPEQVDEMESERTAEIEARGRAREELIRENADAVYRVRQSQADDLDTQADAAIAAGNPHAASGLRRRANLTRDRAEEEYAESQREMDAVAEQVREERAEVRGEIRREIERANEAYAERAAHLRAGLDAEVTQAVRDRYFHGNDAAEVVDWSLLS